MSLPTGTVTFLFTDIEGSTRLLQDLGNERYEAALAEHRQILRNAFATNGGHELGTEGDSFFVVFSTASDGIAAALTGQLRLVTSNAQRLRVRMGLHTGEAMLADGRYIGLSVHHAARVAAAAHGGQILISQATRDVAGTLPDQASLVDLGEHTLKDLAEPTRLYNLAHPGIQAEFPPPRSLSVLPNNLPIQLTSFIGRSREIANIKGLLGSERLVSLVGAGGSGKTRLALQVAAEIVADQPDGVWFVDLAPATEPEHVLRAFAEAVGVREEQAVALEEALTEFLRRRSLLLVVDNCEHVAEPVAELIGQLLHGCPTLKTMATSREPLGTRGETVYRVPSLVVPSEDGTPDAITSAESVRLFCERSAQALSGFAVSEHDAHAVATICRRLDGLPLAIELAAARVRMFTPHEIAERLDQRFKLLTRGAKSVPRHETLRATVDWSYELLTGAERVLFRRLSVFVGGFTLAAAEHICSGDEVDQSDVVDLLASLVDRSLVVAEAGPEKTRYRLLETMREYGHEALLASDESEPIWSRHLDWFASLAEQAYAGLRSRNEGTWLSTIDTELDNIRQALAWSAASGRREPGIRLAGFLQDYWETRWLVAEAYRRIVPFLEPLDELPEGTRALGLARAAVLAAECNDLVAGRRYATACVAMRRTSETERLIADAHAAVARVALLLDRDVETAREHFERCLELRREIGHEFDIADALTRLASLWSTWGAERKRARALQEEALAITRRVGDRTGLAAQLRQLADLTEAAGDIDESLRLRTESIEVFREIGDQRNAALLLLWLAETALNRGEIAHAHELLEEAGTVFRSCDYNDGVVLTLIARSGSARDQGRFAEARSLLAEAESCRDPNSVQEINVTLETAELEYALGNLEEAQKLIEGIREQWRLVPGASWIPTLHLARYERIRGNLKEASRLALEVLDYDLETDEPGVVAVARQILGLIALTVDDFDAATDYLLGALTWSLKTRARPRVARLLADHGELLTARKRYEAAARILGAAESLRESMGVVIYPVHQANYDAMVDEIRAALGDQAFTDAWAVGKQLSMDDAADFAESESR